MPGNARNKQNGRIALGQNGLWTNQLAMWRHLMQHFDIHLEERNYLEGFDVTDSLYASFKTAIFTVIVQRATMYTQANVWTVWKPETTYKFPVKIFIHKIKAIWRSSKITNLFAIWKDEEYFLQKSRSVYQNSSLY